MLMPLNHLPVDSPPQPPEHVLILKNMENAPVNAVLCRVIVSLYL